MIPAAFAYHRAASVDEVLDLLAAYPDHVTLLAGGQSLLPSLKTREASAGVLVDIGRLADLGYVRDSGDHVAIGALTRHRDLETSELLADRAPLLCRAAHAVADPQIRHRGTVGGSFAHADPAADLPAAALALDASVVLRGAGGTRTVPATEFFLGPGRTCLAPGEMLTEIRIPTAAAAHRYSYRKFRRDALEWAVVAVAVAWAQPPRVALAGMGPTPLRAAAVEAALAAGEPPQAAAAHAAEGAAPPSDHRASGEYRSHLARVLVARALTEAEGEA